MADIPSGLLDPETFPARVTGSRLEAPLPERELERLRDAARELPSDPLVQWVRPADPRPSGLQRAGPVAGSVGFASMDIADCCGGGSAVPPDPQLAAGPFHLLAVVNVAFEIYDKSGNVLRPATTFSSFFAGVPGCVGLFDPNVLYDEEADRFILGIDAGGSSYCIAVSASPDPLGTWYATSFSTGSDFFDYPQAGVGVDAIFVGANMFALDQSFIEGRVWAIEKRALYAGNTPLVETRSTGPSNSTPQPMNLHGIAHGTWPASGPHYILTERFDGAQHTVWAWDEPFEGGMLGEVGGDGTVDLVLATGVAAGLPVDAPQAGGADIQAGDWRGLDTEYRNGRIWMTNAIACNPGGGVVNCVRWAEIEPAIPMIVQAGVFASDSEHRVFADLAVDQCDGMAVGYTRSSSSTYPSTWAAGREATDPLGTIGGTEELLKAGEISYSAFDPPPRRWGDYTGMTIDPDGASFWYLGEYAKDTGDPRARWGTWVGSLTVPTCPACESRRLEELQPVADTRTETACLYLRAGPYEIAPGAAVTFSAGRAVILEDGFSAGGTFAAGTVP